MKTLMKILTKTTTGAMAGTMTMTMTMTMTTALTMTGTMTMTMTTDSDVLVVPPVVAQMGLGHHAPTTRGPNVLMAPDPTTGSAKTQTDPPAPMELLLSALTAARLPQSQFVQTPLMLSFSGVKGGTGFQGTIGDLFYISLAINWH